MLERAQRDLAEKLEEDDDLTKSRYCLNHDVNYLNVYSLKYDHYYRKQLEAKARLYEQLAGKGKKITEHDGSKGFLVDFEQKSLRNMSDEREKVGTERLIQFRSQMLFTQGGVVL